MGLKRQAKRSLKRKQISEVKLHKLEVKRIMDEIDIINDLIHFELTEDNVEEEVAKVSALKLGALEKGIILNNNKKKFEEDNTE